MTDGGGESDEGRSEEPESPGTTADAPTEDGDGPGETDPGEWTPEGAADPNSTGPESADPEATEPNSTGPESADSGAMGSGSSGRAPTETTPAKDSERSATADHEGAGEAASDTTAEAEVDTAAEVDPDTTAEADADTTAEAEVDTTAEADAGPATETEPDTATDSDVGSEGPGAEDQAGGLAADSAVPDPEDVPPDVRKYDRFKKIDGSTYDRANEFLRDRTYITAREWAIARLCADFRTETGVEMTKIGEHLPQLVPFMTDTYSPQAVNQARHAFEEKVRKAGATFLYGAMCDFFTAEELDDVMYEATEVAKFLLEVEGVDLAVEEELAAEDRISSVMREVRESSAALRHDEVRCPECGHSFEASEGAREAEGRGN